ncbi:LuxR family transcriptional regulator [Mycobacterium sp. EPa45]|uniref:helix-turn-helix transcriptional regulator n=1 Tax=Mycobacterium sp. EPa45 TaxID=1545728 RepID=UPI00130DA62D|nr:LuxR family transcriptional regulator [Mycobacterium sp. EPa45]
MARGAVERARETEAVAHLLLRAESGPAGLLVEGEAGIGKTTLILDAREQAEDRNFRVLSAHGSPSEVTYAYAAVADLLRDVDSATLAALPDVHRLALERACVGDTAGSGPATDERTVATGFLSVIERISTQRPVLLAIDDAQWLDASSRAVISFAARRLTGRVGMILAFRTGDPEAADAQSWLHFPQPDTVARVTMEPLSLGGVHALVAARLGQTLPRPKITRIHEISGGNPLFALELATSAARDPSALGLELPDSLAALVRRRIGDAADDADVVLLTAACSAAPTIESVSLATEMPTVRTVEVLESMENLGIVRLDGNRVRFAHPLFATGVYANSPPSRRRAVHQKLAAHSARPEVRARHLALAATTADPDTLAALDTAAQATVTQGAPGVAAELVELAIKLGDDSVWRRIRAGELHFRAGSTIAARRHLQTALGEAPPGVLRCMALMWLGAVKAYDDDMTGAVAAMSEAVGEAGDDPALGLLCSLRLAIALVMADRLDDALKCAAQAVELSERLGVPGLRSQALSIWVAGKFAAGHGLDRESLQTALELEDPHGGATTWFRASATEAILTAYTGDLDRAETLMHRVREQMLDGGTEVDIIWAAVHLAAIALWSGRYADGTRLAEEALQRAEQMGGQFALITAWTPQAAAAAYSGREAEARAAAQMAIDTAYEIGADLMAKEPRSSLAFLEVSLSNYSAALTVLQPDLDAFDPAATEIEFGRHLPDAIEALSMLGRPDEAEPLVQALERNGTRVDRPWMLAMGARGRGHVLAARGDLDGAQRALEAAIAHHQRLPMPFETARTQLVLGQLQRRRRRKQDAAGSLREALQTFERLGAPLWATRVQAELARLDGSRGDGRALTPTELRIAELAATGLSNKEIATEMFISDKTVEMNLSRTYRKLGIRSRGGLSAALQTREV